MANLQTLPAGETSIFKIVAKIREIIAFGSGTTRELLTADRTYYVRTDGSDSNTGSANTAGGAFLTLQKAYDAIVMIDLNGYDVTVQIADGTYTSGIVFSSSWTGGGTVTFQGNSGTPANVLVSITGAGAFTISCSLPGDLTIKDLKIATTGSSSNGIAHRGTGTVVVSNINFGAIGAAGLQTAVPGSFIRVDNDCAISGNAAGFCQVQGISEISFQFGADITLTGTPAFSSAFCLSSDNSNAVFVGTVFTGSATGSRFSVSSGAIIQTFGSNPATYLPGNSAGTGTNFGAAPWGLYL